ncbi:hypothetical protein TNCV_1124241 [Trichonephila clavipes]|uniref:Uncharacterized protein n=1 Tax=Trichonephila clavipes TaxID=2585209 RepID=A0A8X6SKS9_TRICX|nr:hypothetical protein TNCV_1124241 [Trichonephila clavipes]
MPEPGSFTLLCWKEALGRDALKDIETRHFLYSTMRKSQIGRLNKEESFGNPILSVVFCVSGSAYRVRIPSSVQGRLLGRYFKVDKMIQWPKTRSKMNYHHSSLSQPY